MTLVEENETEKQQDWPKERLKPSISFYKGTLGQIGLKVKVYTTECMQKSYTFENIQHFCKSGILSNKGFLFLPSCP